MFERDQGICALCKMNTMALRDAIMKLHEDLRSEVVLALGYDLRRKRWWDADHVVPMSFGGAGTGLENLRTLCLPCHRKVTTAQARKAALARRAVRPGARADLFLAPDGSSRGASVQLGAK